MYTHRFGRIEEHMLWLLPPTGKIAIHLDFLNPYLNPEAELRTGTNAGQRALTLRRGSPEDNAFEELLVRIDGTFKYRQKVFGSSLQIVGQLMAGDAERVIDGVLSFYNAWNPELPQIHAKKAAI